MLQTLLNFYKKSSAKELLQEADTRNSKYKNMRWSVFSSITIGYSLFYVCRLSLSVVKSPIINEGILSESQLGIVGSVVISVILTLFVWNAKPGD
jgi:OPA family sugar phosphate sensor protein UhpC-like MFS transporter